MEGRWTLTWSINRIQNHSGFKVLYFLYPRGRYATTETTTCDPQIINHSLSHLSWCNFGIRALGSSSRWGWRGPGIKPPRRPRGWEDVFFFLLHVGSVYEGRCFLRGVCGTLSCVWKRMHTVPTVIGARVKAGPREGPLCAWLSWIPSFFPSRLEYSSWQHIHWSPPSVTEGRTGRWITLRHKASAPFELKSIYAGHRVHVDRIHIWPLSLWVRAAGASFHTFPRWNTQRAARDLYIRACLDLLGNLEQQRTTSSLIH